MYVCAYIHIFIHLLKTELQISHFQHFDWLAGHRLSGHVHPVIYPFEVINHQMFFANDVLFLFFLSLMH